MEERMGAGPLTAAVMTARGEDGTLSRQSFRRETAEGMDASDLTFRQVRFLGCRFLTCDFRAAAFYDCVFQDCAFLSCRLARSFWKGSALTGCKAEGADLRKGRFKDCRLDRLRLRYANLNGALWERCALSDCDLAESACQELKVVKTTLHKTDFTGADLFRAVLKGRTSPAAPWTGSPSPPPARSSRARRSTPPRRRWWPGSWGSRWRGERTRRGRARTLALPQFASIMAFCHSGGSPRPVPSIYTSRRPPHRRFFALPQRSPRDRRRETRGRATQDRYPRTPGAVRRGSPVHPASPGRGYRISAEEVPEHIERIVAAVPAAAVIVPVVLIPLALLDLLLALLLLGRRAPGRSRVTVPSGR